MAVSAAPHIASRFALLMHITYVSHPHPSRACIVLRGTSNNLHTETASYALLILVQDLNNHLPVASLLPPPSLESLSQETSLFPGIRSICCMPQVLSRFADIGTVYHPLHWLYRAACIRRK
jgi:hypothetical protein